MGESGITWAEWQRLEQLRAWVHESSITQEEVDPDWVMVLSIIDRLTGPPIAACSGCDHKDSSWTGVDQTPMGDPDKPPGQPSAHLDVSWGWLLSRATVGLIAGVLGAGAALAHRLHRRVGRRLIGASASPPRRSGVGRWSRNGIAERRAPLALMKTSREGELGMEQLSTEQKQRVYDLHDEGHHPDTIWSWLNLSKEQVYEAIRNRPDFTRPRRETICGDDRCPDRDHWKTR